MTNLIGREQEKQLLNQYIHSNKAEFIALYGRRRVGKTYLVRSLFQEQFAFDVTGVINGSKDEQMASFVQALRRSGMTDEQKRPTKWMDAFSILKELMAQQPKNKPCIIFMDELPCFDTPKARFISAFDHFWNGWAAYQPHIKLIVCGSATSWMVDKLINNHGGLHNRITHEMHLHQFTLKETEAYLRNAHFRWNRLTICQLYMIMGGIPYYLSLLDSQQGLPQNIDRLFFSENGELRREYQRLYHSLFKSPEPYLRIIQLLAGKRQGLTRDEIKHGLNADTGGYLSTLLEDLINCDFIRHYNIRERKVKSNGGIYQLTDFYTLFYHTFCRKPITDAEYWSHTLKSPAHNTWLGLGFERVCMAHIPQIKRALGIDRIHTEYYAWRSKESQPQSQIDLLIERADQLIHICEVKYSQAPYAITQEEDMRLRIRINDFLNETKANDGILLTMITTYGLRPNEHSSDIDAEVTMDQLFE